MTEFKKAFTLAEVPEAQQYGSHQELSAMAKVEPEARQHRSKRAAFTLAEVLITLGIIGVVAAMTIPTLMRDFQHRQIETKLKKSFSVMQNAFELSKVENGDYDNWHWNEVSIDDGRTIHFWNTYIFPYLKVSKVCEQPRVTECFSADFVMASGSKLSGLSSYAKFISFILNDGTSVLSWAGSDSYSPHVQIYVDLNGLSKPNVMGQDVFAMYFNIKQPPVGVGSVDDEGNYTQSSTCQYVSGLSMYGECTNTVPTYYFDPNARVISETGSKNNPSCSTSGLGTHCGAAIKANGWKIPENYPF